MKPVICAIERRGVLRWCVSCGWGKAVKVRFLGVRFVGRGDNDGWEEVLLLLGILLGGVGVVDCGGGVLMV